MCFYCLVGHGKSSGEKVFIEDFQIYVRDVIQHIELLKTKYSNIPLFLLGHSMVSNVLTDHINCLLYCIHRITEGKVILSCDNVFHIFEDTYSNCFMCKCNSCSWQPEHRNISRCGGLQ